MQSKVVFIIPFFGKFNNYFPVFLKTCKYNPQFTWMIFTDDETEYDYPDNVIHYKMTFETLKKIVASKFDFNIAMQSAYKLCDFKPAYGFIFEEYIKEYDWWGHCDVDIILGNLSSYITDELLEKYDKLFCLGHMVLYKNTNDNNRVFMNKYKGELLYKKVYSNPSICWFDEEWKDDKNINRIFLDSGKRVLQMDWSANFMVWENKFIRTVYKYDDEKKTYSYETDKVKDALYYWKNGRCKRAYIIAGILYVEEFMYIHLQKRKMKVDSCILSESMFKIVPNQMRVLEANPENIDEYKTIKRNYICFHELSMKCDRLIRNYKRRYKKLLMLFFGKGSNESKKI